MNIELRHLRYFVAVAEEEGFTAAAHRVHVAQQALSTQIRRRRGDPAARPDEQGDGADAGRRRVPGHRTGDPLEGLDRGVTAARNAAQAVSGTLTVGLGPGCENETRTRLLGDFERAYPDVEVCLQTFDMTQPAAGLLDHSTDVALLRPPLAAPAIELAPVRSEERMFVLPAGHPLAGRDKLTLADVAGLPFVTAPSPPTAASRAPGRTTG